MWQSFSSYTEQQEQALLCPGVLVPLSIKPMHWNFLSAEIKALEMRIRIGTCHDTSLPYLGFRLWLEYVWSMKDLGDTLSISKFKWQTLQLPLCSLIMQIIFIKSNVTVLFVCLVHFSIQFCFSCSHSLSSQQFILRGFLTGFYF